MSIDMDRTCRVYFFIYDPDSGGEAVRQGARCFSHSNLFGLIQTGSGRKPDVLLFYTYSDWFKLVQAEERCFTNSNTDWFQTGTGRMQDVLLNQTYSDRFKLAQAGCKMFYYFKHRLVSNWYRQDARCFTHSNLFRLVQTGSGRMQDVLLIQTYSDWFKLAQAGCQLF
jgi:hypothetical protein